MKHIFIIDLFLGGMAKMMLHAICFCGLLRDVKCHFCFFVSFVLNLQSFKSCEL